MFSYSIQVDVTEFQIAEISPDPTRFFEKLDNGVYKFDIAVYTSKSKQNAATFKVRCFGT